MKASACSCSVMGGQCIQRPHRSAAPGRFGGNPLGASPSHVLGGWPAPERRRPPLGWRSAGAALLAPAFAKTDALPTGAGTAVGRTPALAATLITFDEGLVSEGDTLFDQYAAMGVFFTPNGFTGTNSITGNPFATNSDMTITATDLGGLGSPALVSGNLLHSFGGWLAEDGDPSIVMTFAFDVSSVSADFAGMAIVGSTGLMAYRRRRWFPRPGHEREHRSGQPVAELQQHPLRGHPAGRVQRLGRRGQHQLHRRGARAADLRADGAGPGRTGRRRAPPPQLIAALRRTQEAPPWRGLCAYWRAARGLRPRPLNSLS
jgi:hypothetical protein